MSLANQIKRQTAAVVAINQKPDPMLMVRKQIADLEEQVRHEQAECERLEQELATEQQRTRTAQDARVHDAERAARAEAVGSAITPHDYYQDGYRIQKRGREDEELMAMAALLCQVVESTYYGSRP